MNEKEEVVELYQRFDKYKIHTKEQLLCHIEQSFKLNQYKIHRKNNKVVAFTNFAFMSDKHEEHYKKTGQMLFNFWNSGDNCWIIDSVCHDDNFDAVYEWAKKYFTMQLGIDKPVSWLRVEDICKIKEQQTKYTKEKYIDG